MNEKPLGMAWSEDGQVFYDGDNAWGVQPVSLRTIWLGKREDIEKEHPVGKPQRTPRLRRVQGGDVAQAIKERRKR